MGNTHQRYHLAATGLTISDQFLRIRMKRLTVITKEESSFTDRQNYRGYKTATSRSPIHATVPAKCYQNIALGSKISARTKPIRSEETEFRQSRLCCRAHLRALDCRGGRAGSTPLAGVHNGSQAMRQSLPELRMTPRRKRPIPKGRRTHSRVY